MLEMQKYWIMYPLVPAFQSGIQPVASLLSNSTYRCQDSCILEINFGQRFKDDILSLPA